MKPVQTLLRTFDRIKASGAEAARPKVRRAPACEMLEGRQLLNAAWTPPQGFAGWDGAAGQGADPAAHVHSLDANGLHGAGHNFKLTGAPGGAGHAFAFPGGPNGVAPSGFAGKTFKAPTPSFKRISRPFRATRKRFRPRFRPA